VLAQRDSYWASHFRIKRSVAGHGRVGRHNDVGTVFKLTEMSLIKEKLKAEYVKKITDSI
jgi:hypothetical protein